MAKLFISLLLLVVTTTTAKAAAWVQAVNWGTHVQFMISNMSPKAVDCEGPFSLIPETGDPEHYYLKERVWRGTYSFKDVYLSNGGLVKDVFHGITCKRV